MLTWLPRAIDASTGQPVTAATSGFLPPDRHPPEGEGGVSFTVTPKPGLRTGARIGNGARIFFDTNAPIDTPTWLNTIDGTAPSSSRITAVAHSRMTLRVRRGRRQIKRRRRALAVHFRGRDRGSGAAAFDVFIEQGHGRFLRLLHAAPTSVVQVSCVKGRRYRFYVVAHDAAGNVQRGHSPPSRPALCR